MKHIAVIPIRNDSTRLKNKATGFHLYKKYTPLECIIKRLEHSKLIDEIVFIMPNKKENKPICDIVDKYAKKNKKLRWYMGSENDITLRALEAIDYQDCCIIDITGDCPLIDTFMIDDMIGKFDWMTKDYRNTVENIHNVKAKHYTYLSNVMTRSYPDGFDIQIFESGLLEMAYYIALDKKSCTNFGWDIVHYSGLLRSIFKRQRLNLNLHNFPASERNWHPTWELTLDYEEDIEVISAVFNHFKRFDFTVDEVVDFISDNRHLLAKNKDCKRKISGE